jgi:osmotically-inducible protein OsmY
MKARQSDEYFRGKNMNTRMKTILMAGALIAAASTLSSQAADQAASTQAADQSKYPAPGSAAQIANDQRITSDVQTELSNDQRLYGPGEIGVTTERDGKVTLKGNVITPNESDNAVSDAHSVDGVTGVKNKLRVDVGQDF